MMRQEDQLMSKMMEGLDAVFQSNQNKGLITFKSIGKLLLSDEMINQYHQIDTNPLKVSIDLLPMLIISKPILHHMGVSSITTGDMITQLFKTKEKYIFHLINEIN